MMITDIAKFALQTCLNYVDVKWMAADIFDPCDLTLTNCMILIHFSKLFKYVVMMQVGPCYKY